MKESHYNMYMKQLETLDTTMGHHWAAASITTKRNLKVDLGKCVQMYRAPFLYLPGAHNLLNPPLHTRHDNMKARSQWNTQVACHTAQDITWMHAADKNQNYVQHYKTHVDSRARGRAKSRPHTHTTRQNTERESPNPGTKPKLKARVPGSEHHAPTWNKALRREGARLEHTRSRVLT